MNYSRKITSAKALDPSTNLTLDSSNYKNIFETTQILIIDS